MCARGTKDEPKLFAEARKRVSKGSQPQGRLGVRTYVPDRKRTIMTRE